MALQKTLKKTPRTVLYSIGGVAILILIAAVIAEILEPGSIQGIREATEVVVVEVGLILASLAAIVPAVLALLNLSDDEPNIEPAEDAPL